MSIDYGMGRTNIDKETGIRFGVISQHSISQAWCDCSQGVYPCGDCDCPKDEETGEFLEECNAEATEFEYTAEGYDMQSCLDSDVMVIRSPWFTLGPFCSPCVPGAVNLDAAGRMWVDTIMDKYGVEGYCPDHDWFDDGVAPYRVFSVLTRREVFPDSYYGQ